MGGDRQWASIPGMVRSSADRFGDQEAIVDGSVRLSFRDVEREMVVACRAAMASGIGPGARVGIWAPNSVEWIIAALGIQAAGGAVVTLNTRFKGGEAATILTKSKASTLFTSSGFLDTNYPAMLQEAQPALADLPTILTKGQAPGCTSWAEFLARAEEVSEAAAIERLESVTCDDVADVIFTSGTTGMPKGVVTTHGQDLRVYQAYNDLLGLRAGDRYLVILPFFHCFGYKAGWLSSLMQGATTLPLAVFNMESVLQIIEAERITVLPGPPTLLAGLLDHPDRSKYDLSSLRFTVTGAAMIPVELIERLRSEGLFETVLTGYGLTETSGVVSLSRPDDPSERIARWAGRPIPDVEVRVVDGNGQQVPRGEQGEIVVRGYNVMSGYLDEPDETARTIDVDGWLHTGDIGVIDDDDYIKITDRKKDMFIVGGFNAYPAEIERLLLEHPGVAQVAVVGMPDERMGEVGAAFVVTRPGTGLTAEELISWARDHMANFKAPRYVELVDGLPMNASMKVVKAELRERAARAVAGAKQP